MTAKKIITTDKFTATHRCELAGWLAERIGELEPDEESIREEYQTDLVAALRGLQQRLGGKAPL